MDPLKPINPVNLFDFEARAAQNIPPMAYDYYATGANDLITLRENRAAFDRLKLRPRMLRNVLERDHRTTILGQPFASPILIAPMALQRMAHPDGELAMAKAASALQVGICLSTMSSVTLEAVAQATTAPCWFQLYVYKDRALTRSLVERAVAAGYQALVVTIDTPLLGKREADIRNQMTIPEQIKFANFSGGTVERLPIQPNESGFQDYIASLWDSTLTWVDIDWLVSISSIPVLVKGILRGDDAQIALEHGVQGIIVSNHGGRQLDTALAGIEALPEVIEAVAGRVDVLMDGGVRRGTDVLKALALGAKGVLVGRPILWGLGYNGEAGVREVLSILHAEFDLAMALAGCRSIHEITRDLVV